DQSTLFKLAELRKKESDELLSINQKLADGEITEEESVKYKEAINLELQKGLNKLKLSNNASAEAVELFKSTKNEAKSVSNELLNQKINLDSSNGLLDKMGQQFGKNNKYYEQSAETADRLNIVQKSIGIILQNNTNISKEDQSAILKKIELSKSFNQEQISINSKAAEGLITERERVELLTKASERYKEESASIAMSAQGMKEFGDVVSDLDGYVEKLGKSATTASSKFQLLDDAVKQLSGGIPALDELNTVLKTNIKDTLAWKAAIFALGAALGKAAFDYFGAPIKVAQKAQYEIAKNQIETAQKVRDIEVEAAFIPQKINQEVNQNKIQTADAINKATIDAAFAQQRAMNQFNAQLKSSAAQFEAASKTALFGKGLGSVGYGTAQLQLAGIGAEKIASAMEAASSATGKMPIAAVGADMAVMAERTGQSVESIAQINEYFQRTDKVSAKVAMNMQEGLRAMADQAGIGLGNLMREVAEASKDALSYQIKSGPALAKAVAYTQSMGLNFQDVAKAGKSMVLNYKDSIKAEMQLSSLLGEQVDLSEVRAKFAAGDTTGALEALKAQGLDPEQMDMFQQEALQQALGGLDLQSLSKIATKTGAQTGELKTGDATKAGKEFLGAKVEAERTLQSKQASISAQQAIIDAALSGKITDAYLNSPGYLKYQQEQSNLAKQQAELAGQIERSKLADAKLQGLQADMMKLDYAQNIKENLMSGFAMLAGGILTTMGAKLALPIAKGVGKVVSAPFKLAGKGVSAVSSIAGKKIQSVKGVATKGLASIGSKFGIGKPSADATSNKKGIIPKIKSIFQFGKKGQVTPAAPTNLTTESGLGGAGALFSKSNPGYVIVLSGEMSAAAGGASVAAESTAGDKLKEKAGEKLGSLKEKAGEKLENIKSSVSESAKNMVGRLKGKFKKGRLGKKFGKISSIAESVTGSESEEGEAGSALSELGAAAPEAAPAGDTLKSVAEAAPKGIEGILKGIAAGLQAFTPPVLVGAGILAGVIVAIGAGIAGAAWIMGKALPTLAEGLTAFNTVDGGNLAKVGLGITALGVGIAAMGAGAVIGGIGNLVGKLFGGGIEDTIKKVEVFSKANIDAAKVKENADAIIAYSKAMAMSGLGSAAAGIGNLVGNIADGISKFFGGGDLPLDKMKAFAAADLGDTSKLKANAEAFMLFGNAMSSYTGGGGMGDVLAAGVAKFFGIKQKLPIEQFKEFAAADFGDLKNLKKNAEAYT
ncbi:hypothetical protein EBR43_10055, partial [bacterium]|nr:hypothetical protein [bacterium]